MFLSPGFSQPLLILSGLPATPTPFGVLFLPFLWFRHPAPGKAALLLHYEHHWSLIHCWGLPSFCPDPEAGGLPRKNGESSSVGMFMAVPGSLSSAWRCFFLVAWSLFSWLWLSVKIYLVALFFTRSEENPWERIILSWDDASSRQFEKGNGQHVGYWTSITQKAYPCFSYFLSFTTFIEAGGRAYTVWSSSSFSAPPTSY